MPGWLTTVWNSGGRQFAIYVGLPCLCVLLLIYVFQRSFIYFPGKERPVGKLRTGLGPEQLLDVQVRTTDGLVLNGWHYSAFGRALPDRNAADQSVGGGAVVVLYFSGNAGHRGDRVPFCRAFTALGCHVFHFDYRGYGDNEGTPNEHALTADARDTWNYLVAARHIEPQQIVLYGESLGGAVALRLAADLCRAGSPPRGVIVCGAFTSLAEIGAHAYPFLPVRSMLWDRFDALREIPAVTAPILILHGRKDTLVPLKHAERLHAAAPEKSAAGIARKLVVFEEAGHNDILETAGAAYRQAVGTFLRSLSGESPAGGTPQPAPVSPAPEVDEGVAELQRALTFVPWKIRPVPREPTGRGPDRLLDVTVTAYDGLPLHGWHFLPGERSTAGNPDAARLEAGELAVLYFPGNAGHRALRGAYANTLARLNCHVFLFDYRGYGDNDGTPTEAALHADARTCWNALTQDRQIPADRIVIYGESLGGGVAVRLASDLCRERTPPAGLVLCGTFSSLVDAAQYHYPLLPAALLVKDRFDAIGAIPEMTAPLLLIHGLRDDVVPLDLGRKLFAAAPEQSSKGIAKTLIVLPNAGHNDVIETSGALYQQALSAFLEKVRR